MFNSVVRHRRINRISRSVLTTRPRRWRELVLDRAPDSADDRLLSPPRCSLTTACVPAGAGHLEEAGYEVLVFHASGNAARRWSP